MVYWSDRSISFFDHLDDIEHEGRLWKLPNGYYLSDMQGIGNHVVVGLLLVKHDYTHENRYLENTFFKDFNMPPEFQIVEAGTETSFPIKSIDGEYIFSLEQGSKALTTTPQLYLPGLLYMISLLFLFIFIRLEMARNEVETVVKLVFLAVGLFLIYWLHIMVKVPNLFYNLDFFSPSYFAYNIWLPTLGDYLLLSVFFFFWALNFNFDINIKRLKASLGISTKLGTAFLFTFCGGLFLLVNKAIYILVYNSSISFSLNRINDLSAQSIIGFLSIAIILLALFLIAARVMEEIRKTLSKKQINIGICCASVLMVLLQWLFTSKISLPIIFYFVAVMFLLNIINRKYLQKYTLSYLIMFVSIATFYSLTIVNQTALKKINEAQKLLSMNLVAEHDAAAEVMLYNVQGRINVDSEIPELLTPPYEELEYYISNTYFSGFFRKYDLQITTCDGNDKLTIEPDKTVVECFPFFDQMIAEEGVQVPGTNFYFMDRMNGRISYFGKLHYPWASVNDSLGISVFVELISSIASEGLGYPELLLDKSMEKPEIYKNFSYAKYNNGMLVDRHGDFLYSHYLESYNIGNNEFTIKRWNNHRHVIYKTDNGNHVIVSREIFSFGDYLISFPYLFCVLFFAVISFFYCLGASQSGSQPSVLT